MRNRQVLDEAALELAESSFPGVPRLLIPRVHTGKLYFGESVGLEHTTEEQGTFLVPRLVSLGCTLELEGFQVRRTRLRIDVHCEKLEILLCNHAKHWVFLLWGVTSGGKGQDLQHSFCLFCA